VERVDTFIGNDKKLFKWFKEFVGYDGKDEIVENIPATVTRPDFLQSKSFGQSYRLIPRMVSSYWNRVILDILYLTLLFSLAST
jgi:histone deacetylase complex regulatory component SIN3